MWRGQKQGMGFLKTETDVRAGSKRSPRVWGSRFRLISVTCVTLLFVGGVCEYCVVLVISRVVQNATISSIARTWTYWSEPWHVIYI